MQRIVAETLEAAGRAVVERHDYPAPNPRRQQHNGDGSHTAKRPEHRIAARVPRAGRDMTDIPGSKKVAYLIGAGASHACVKTLGSPNGILMSDLATELVAGVKHLVQSNAQYRPLLRVVNEIVGEEADFEHLITFFDESPSSVHRAFADGMREVFEAVLNARLQDIEMEYGSKRMSLYAALFDMYNVKGIDESLHGVLTLNYDDYIEVAAAEIHDSHRIDLDFSASRNEARRSWFLKLHGSFAWEDAWPIRRREAGSSSRPLWIPPGIRKGKERYPFNLLWGLARDVLNCDVLRVIGCRLGPSDWDLISLLFSTRHANRDRDHALLDRDHRLPRKCRSAPELLSVPRRQVAFRDRYARRWPESGRRVPG